MSEALSVFSGNPILLIFVILALAGTSYQVAMMQSATRPLREDQGNEAFEGAFAAPRAWLKKHNPRNELLLEQQINQFETQMAENSRVGLSVERSLRACLEQYDDPLKTHLERMLNELVYTGATLSDAFENFAERAGSSDARMLASVISVQQETGSSLADTLDFLSSSIAERQKMRQTLRSRLAEMRLTKLIVAFTPLLIIAICCFAIHGVADFYLTNPIGWALLGACAVGEVVGIYALNRLSKLPIE